MSIFGGYDEQANRAHIAVEHAYRADILRKSSRDDAIAKMTLLQNSYEGKWCGTTPFVPDRGPISLSSNCC